MSDLELIDAVAHVTGEDANEIRRRGFMLTGPEDSGSNPEPECLLDVMLVDLPESGTVERVCTFVCSQKPPLPAATRTNCGNASENTQSCETLRITAARCKPH